MRTIFTIFFIIGLFQQVRAQSPTIASTPQLSLMEELGKALFFDKISHPDKMSCTDRNVEKQYFLDILYKSTLTVKNQ